MPEVSWKTTLVAILSALAVAGGIFSYRELSVASEGDAPAKTEAPASNPADFAPFDSATSAAAAPRKIRVLIVPGHEPADGGTVYRGIRERDLTAELGSDLGAYLRADPTFEAVLTRDAGGWNPVFSGYFNDEREAIASWRDASRRELSRRLEEEAIPKPETKVGHESASPAVANRLYGITKWANENSVDVIIHLHLNDYRYYNSSSPGKYTGVAVYVPPGVYGNGTSSRSVAESVLARLTRFNPVSDLRGESDGVVEDPQLIAVGANDTAREASLLIEYGYIYEPQFVDSRLRTTALKDLAYQTYLGLRDRFAAETAEGIAQNGSVILPHEWKKRMTSADADPADVFALQTALILDGNFPPPKKNLNVCPRNGRFGPCTQAALKYFQAGSGIIGEDGFVGVKTLAALNARFSPPSP